MKKETKENLTHWGMAILILLVWKAIPKQIQIMIIGFSLGYLIVGYLTGNFIGLD